MPIDFRVRQHVQCTLRDSMVGVKPAIAQLVEQGSGISSVVMAASLFRPVLGSIPGSNTELDRRSVNPSLQSGNGEPGSE